jgi:hypothetical protein
MPINTRTHGIMDYVIGLVLIVAPWVLGFANNGPETWIPVGVGVAALVYSLLTDYEYGVVRAIPMPIHLVLDGLAGLLLAMSPWIFGFSEVVWIPHLVIGLLEIGAAVMTQRHPGAHTSPLGATTR